MIPRATYRFQFHKDFPFAAADALVPYLDRLGISHVYASPITTAAAGSMHGYDVIDPTRINPELGGEEAFRRLVAALRARGMGIIIDIVPNHMGVAGGGNAWWNDVLRHGQASRYARFFDIDWSERLVLPILGDPLADALDKDVFQVERDGDRVVLTAYGSHKLPIRDEDQAGLRDGPPLDREGVRQLIDRQHYRPSWWRAANDELNWRRFFTVNDLAGLRIEDEAVFEETHQLYFRLYAQGLIDGVRVDHVDGLTDPAGYCRTLRQRLDAIERPADAPPGPAYIVIEKILGARERLATDWGVDGTSGYDFMEEAAALIHCRTGDEPLTALWTELSGRPADFAAEELRARREMLSWQFEGQLGRCVAAFAALAASSPETEGLTAGMLRRAIERLLWVFPVYRTYGTGTSAPATDAAIRARARRRVERLLPPGEAMVADQILTWLAGDGPGDPALAAEAVRRFQQLSAPIAAKAVEDTAFYRHNLLLSRTDVGFEPGHFASSLAEFHHVVGDVSRDFPHRLLATATHDHKRGEDVRARLALLSDLPSAWGERVRRWRTLNRALANGVDPADEYALYQTLFGAWPAGLAPGDGAGVADYAARIVEWQRKALREAKLRSSWAAPDEAYEDRAAAFAQALLDPARSSGFLTDLAEFVAWTAAPALANILAQVALRYTVPGVPDCYQGTELPDFSLVDPDNRRPVDYEERQRLLAAHDAADPAGAKLRLIADLLALRRRHEALFRAGDYAPLTVEGPRAGHILAFARRHGGETLVIAVLLCCGEALTGRAAAVVPADWWGDTRIALPAAAGLDGRAAVLFTGGPVFVSIVRAAAAPDAD